MLHSAGWKSDKACRQIEYLNLAANIDLYYMAARCTHFTQNISFDWFDLNLGAHIQLLKTIASRHSAGQIHGLKNKDRA